MRDSMILGLVLALLAGCTGGGDTGGGDPNFCAATFSGGSTDWSCTNCSGVDPLDNYDDFDPAIDNNSGTYRQFGLFGDGQIVISARAPQGRTFPAGSDAGALMRFPTGTYASIGVTFNVYRGSTPVNQASGGETAAGNVQGAGSDIYYSVDPTLEFDRIDAVVQVTGATQNASFRMYEFCGNR